NSSSTRAHSSGHQPDSGRRVVHRNASGENASLSFRKTQTISRVAWLLSEFASSINVWTRPTRGLFSNGTLFRARHNIQLLNNPHAGAPCAARKILPAGVQNEVLHQLFSCRQRNCP